MEKLFQENLRKSDTHQPPQCSKPLKKLKLPLFHDQSNIKVARGRLNSWPKVFAKRIFSLSGTLFVCTENEKRRARLDKNRPGNKELFDVLVAFNVYGGLFSQKQLHRDRSARFCFTTVAFLSYTTRMETTTTNK
jgi:hypothetical protein